MTADNEQPVPTAKITVGLVAKAARDLQVLAARTGSSKTDLVNKAIQLYEFVDLETTSGAELRLHRADGSCLLIALF